MVIVNFCRYQFNSLTVGYQSNMLLNFILVCLVGFSTAAKLDEVFSWKEVEFAWPSEDIKNAALKNGDYVPYNNLPLGIAQWRNKLFVTVPRWRAGVGASLNYIPLNTTDKSPKLIPYPDFKANTLPKGEEKLEDNHIVSTFRVQVDKCDRLWVMDTGLADIFGTADQHSKPALVVFDLNTDKLIRRYEFKPTDQKESSFFANVVVDAQAGSCEDAFAYVPDLGGYGIVVYSWKSNASWRVNHNYFHFDPLNGDFNVGGVNFQWTDGVFGLALGEVQSDGYRTLYFHPLASTHEFSVSTQVLRNETVATDPHSYYSYTNLGNRGNLTQASASDYDDKSGVLFLTQLNRDAVACWNSKKPLSPETLGLVAQDKEALVFTNDLKIGDDRTLWILSDKMPAFLFSTLNPNEINYRIFKVKIEDAIANTVCQN